MGMIFLSNEDIDVKRVTARWLVTQKEEHRAEMSQLLDDYFHRALAFVLKHDMVVDTTLVGTVNNGLTAIHGATCKGEFICGLIRGLGGNLSLADRAKLGSELFQWSGERPADPNAPLDCDYEKSGYAAFVTDSAPMNKDADGGDGGGGGANPFGATVISTVSAQRNAAMLQPLADQMQPFILVGPEGCGKNMMIRHLFGQRKKTLMSTLHCNAQTTAEHVITKIAQTCSLFSAPEGRVYRPVTCAVFHMPVAVGWGGSVTSAHVAA